MSYQKIIDNIVYIAIQFEYMDTSKFNIKYIIQKIYIFIYINKLYIYIYKHNIHIIYIQI